MGTGASTATEDEAVITACIALFATQKAEYERLVSEGADVGVLATFLNEAKLQMKQCTETAVEKKSALSQEYSVIVVGGGAFGAAAAKYLAQASAGTVLCIGPEASSTDPYCAHNDVSRLYRVQHAAGFWNSVSQKSIARYEDIAAAAAGGGGGSAANGASGAGDGGGGGGNIDFKFHYDIGFIGLSVFDSPWRRKYESADSTGVPYASASAGDDVKAVRVSIPPGVDAKEVKIFRQDKDAGVLNPLKMIKAQLSCFLQAGGEILRDYVTSVAEGTDGLISVHTKHEIPGTVLTCRKLLLCNGCFLNTVPVTPKNRTEPLVPLVPNLQLQTQSVVLFEIQEQDVALLPTETIIFGGATKDAPGELKDDSCYLVPPIKYEKDGKFYLKMGHGKELELVIDAQSEQDIRGWYDGSDGNTNNNKNDKEVATNMTEIFSWMFPAVTPVSTTLVRNGITTHTDNNELIMRMLDDNGGSQIGVVTACNGYGAKGSDEIGRLAAEMLLGNKE